MSSAIMKLAVATAALSFVGGACGAEEFSRQRLANWHQWRGPDATGMAPRGNPPMRWDEQTNIKWKVAIPGNGTSTPVIWGDRIFLQTAIKTDRQIELPTAPADAQTKADGKGGPREKEKERPKNFYRFVVLCLERKAGRVLWERIAAEVVPHQKHHNTSSYAAHSPVTDGRFVYCSFGSRGVYCYDVDGSLQWKADVGQFDIKFEFGEGSSPVLHQETLIVNCDHEGQSFITALDAKTGRQKWKVLREENSTWNTPLIAEYGGRTQIVVNGAKAAKGYDLATGDLIWSYGGPAGVDAIPSPVRFGDLAICMTGFRGNPAYAVPLRATGELTDADLAWKHVGGTPQISTPVLVGERLFFTKDRLGVMTCLNARTGDVIMSQERLPLQGDVYPSPVAAVGRVYFTARNGTTAVIDAAANELRVLAVNKLAETVVGSPAIVGQEMFIRGDKNLFCIAELQ